MTKYGNYVKVKIYQFRKGGLHIALNLKNDLLFKAVYGREDEECKQALIAVLNLILDRKDNPITAIVYKNPFNVRENETQKESILDIKAETEQGELLDLEIHLLYDADFIHRNIYYHGGMITQALESGEEYVKIKKTISIFIVDFCLFPQTDQYASKFLFKEERENFVLTELVELHYLELPKVNPGRKKTAGELTKLERYLEYLRCAGDASCREYLEDLRSQGGKEIAMTEKLLRKATADEIVREQAIARDKFRLQQHCREVQFKKGLAQAFEDGQKEGIAQGRSQGISQGISQGKEEGQKELVRNLAASGMERQQIARMAKLSLETVEAWLKG